MAEKDVETRFMLASDHWRSTITIDQIAMTKTNNNKKPKLTKKKTVRKARKPARSAPLMGPVSTITTAPVAFGNTITGSKSLIKQTPNGVMIAGRDFMFTAVQTRASVTDWCTVGGTPLTPAAFSDSTLRQYMQLYQKFRWRALNVHYITSSPTSSNGDVLFYHGKNRDSVFLNQTSKQFLPFVISDPDTILGPQWSNHSASLAVTSDWKSCDYGMHSGVNDYSAGEVFLLSKTSSTESPGYVIFDYVIEFAEMQVSPRLLTLPITRIQYTNFGTVSTTYAEGDVIQFPLGGANLGNTVTSTSEMLPGDIYKVILDKTNSGNPLVTVRSVTGTASSNFTSITVTDGTTVYGVYTPTALGDLRLLLYPTVEEAYTNTNPLRIQGTGTAITAIIQQLWLSYVGSLGSNNINPAF